MRRICAGLFVALSIVTAIGCKAKPTPKSHDERVARTASTDTTDLAAPTAHAAVPTSGELADGGAPSGYVRASVLSVVSLRDGGNAVLLVDDGGTVLPIFIGGSEALAISLRLHGETADRPLTHDLLSALVDELGGHALEAHVDALKGDTYVGSVYVEQNGRVLKLDARPSDAIAMALGSHVPIYVAKPVFAEGGVSRDDLDQSRDRTLDAKRKKGAPISL